MSANSQCALVVLHKNELWHKHRVVKRVSPITHLGKQISSQCGWVWTIDYKIPDLLSVWFFIPYYGSECDCAINVNSGGLTRFT